MIHTFELTSTTNSKKAINILTEYCDLNEIPKLITESKDKKIKIPLHNPGIMEVSISYIGSDFYRLYLRVEPQSLILGRRTIEVFDCTAESIKKLRTDLPRAIKDISTLLPNVERWNVSRIDYTMNLITNYEKQCVELAKKGRDPYRYKDIINQPGSSYRKSKSVILNFYDKLDHIEKKVDWTSSYACLLDEAMNIFRIEVQCLDKNKLKHIRKKFNLPSKANIYDYVNPDIARYLIFYYYNIVIGTGDYYSMKEAVKKVQETKWSSRKKENLKRWLQLIAQARSISRAREQFIEGTVLKNTQILVKGTNNTFTNYINACKEININPVTIPKDWKIKYIPNPVKIDRILIKEKRA